MKKFSLLLLALIASVGTMFAENIEVDGIWYAFNKNAKTATVEAPSGTAKYSGDIVIPSSVTYYSTHYKVTSIGMYAFSNCTGLTSIEIPNSVTDISYKAFEGCTSLTSITIPSEIDYIDNTIFIGCSGLTSLTIGESVTTIEEGAFSDCTNLTSVTINSNAIVSKDYDVTTSLKDIFGEKVTSYALGDSVKRIGNFAFSFCDSLTSITISKSLTSIGIYAFDLVHIHEIHFTGSVDEWITRLWDPADITDYYDLYLKEKKLTAVVIPTTITEINDRAFVCCTSLTSVTIPDGVKSIGDNAFWSTSLTSVNIPNSVTNIGVGAFAVCKSLTSATFPNSVTSVGDGVFYGTGITTPIYNSHIFAYLPASYTDTLTIPYGIKTIAGGACIDSKISSVEIPNSVTSIGWSAFSNCKNLTSVTCMAINPPAAEDAFYQMDCSKIPLYVPKKSISAYKDSTQWNEFNPILPFGTGESAEEIETSEVVATPTEEGSVVLEWPVVEDVVIYTVDIKKNGELICTLEFDENGTLLSKTLYMPARNGNRHNVPAAEQSAKGWRYIVEGLEAGVEYTYTITAKKSDDSVLFTETVNFTMPSSQGIEDIRIEAETPTKILMDGQIYILQADHIFDAQGKMVK